jgi:hypothetical protein
MEKLMKVSWSLLPPLLLMTAPAGALESYCDSSYVRVRDGGHYEAPWKVVHPKARRGGSTTCSLSYSSVGGMYRPIEIIKAPRNGEAHISNTYRIVYKPSKIGPDELVIKIHWIGQTGERSAGTVRYNIQVVDRPL